MMPSSAPSFGVTGPAPIAVADLRDFLVGAWRLERVIDDARLGRTGTMAGRAVFAPDGPLLRYSETGELRLGHHRGPASQIYLYRFPAPQRAEVLFADGRLFHVVDLGGGAAETTHRCAADLYRGRFEVISRDDWRVTWRIDGPRKRQRIATSLRRLAAADPSGGPPRSCA